MHSDAHTGAITYNFKKFKHILEQTFPRFKKYNWKSKSEHEHEQIHGIETRKKISAHWLAIKRMARKSNLNDVLPLIHCKIQYLTQL
jgi:hypothetical protein